jgi:hypothetical protein
MDPFEGYEGSYCEECCYPLTKPELKRVATRTKAERIYCDRCLTEREVCPGWFEMFLYLLEQEHGSQA